MSEPGYNHDIPPELISALISVLAMHIGKERATGRRPLLETLRASGFVDLEERVMREAIRQARRQGHLICSLPGNNGGYYFARDLKEFDEFIRMEYTAKIADMSETRAAMERSAREMFGEAQQLRLGV